VGWRSSSCRCFSYGRLSLATFAPPLHFARLRRLGRLLGPSRLRLR
jgi:hypothetical protein